MKYSIFFEKEGFEDILGKLNAELDAINKVYYEIDNKSKLIGDEENWKGIGQKSFFNSYKSISKKFSPIVANLTNCNSFLKNTIDAYCKEDEMILKSLEENSKDFSINEGTEK